MRAILALGTLVLASLFAGCAADRPQTPVPANPKLLVDRSADGLTEIYVHGAFRETPYREIVLTIDNVTVERRSDSYALDVKVEATEFDIRVDAAGEANYTVRALVRIPVGDDFAEVALHDAADGFGDSREVKLPWQTILGAVPEEEES